ncbi:MAG: rhodanese-like domain-containing protein [bacterium]|nr:rhodanese-like domain-containing protein [bacterium]
MFKKIAIVAVLVALAAAPAAVAQTPAVQEAVFNYIANLPSDYMSIGVPALKAKLDAGEKPFMVDIREANETATGYIQGALLMPMRTVPRGLERFPTDRNAEIIFICGSGLRSSYTVMAFSIMGYRNVKGLALGMREWNAQTFPVVK